MELTIEDDLEPVQQVAHAIAAAVAQRVQGTAVVPSISFEPSGQSTGLLQQLPESGPQQLPTFPTLEEVDHE